ncbi:MAG: lytic transglycosylase domain-containing protein [Selenomonadaceae bacterium]|nr:lytic transglycosylase domain-containing protein [Selenomonadaceae bacterium]
MKKNVDRRKRFKSARRKLRRSLRIALFIFLSAIAIYSIVEMPTVQRGVFYPFHYRDTVEMYSAKYHVDKYLAIAVMKNESNFSSSAISRSGAVGLMQLMPETAGWIATQLEDEPLSDENFSFNVKRLYDPETNIRYGIWYLSTLEEEFDGNDVLALAAYNAGRGNVWHWVDEYGWGADFDDVDQIPFKETRDYVRRVLNCRLKYQLIYNREEG